MSQEEERNGREDIAQAFQGATEALPSAWRRQSQDEERMRRDNIALIASYGF